MSSLQQTTDQFTHYIRNPDEAVAPANIEPRRLKIYADLFYRNIESFISGAFPVLRSLIEDAGWHRLVRDFMVNYRCQTPYFLEISQEFQHYLSSSPDILKAGAYPEFICALAHYEWVELALDVAEDDLNLFVQAQNLSDSCDWLQQQPVVSPLAWSLAYQYPVHLIGQEFQPAHVSDNPSYLIVYRNLQDVVGFMEANAVTARLLELASDTKHNRSGRTLLLQLAAELQHPQPEQIVDSGLTIFQQLYDLDILLGSKAI